MIFFIINFNRLITMIRPWVHFPEYNVCVAFMPKVANTSMKMAFAELKGMDRFSKSQIGIHSHFKGVAPEQIAHLDCPKIMFVRNPFDRLVSAWQSKLIDKDKHPSFDKFGMTHNMSFEDFAMKVCSTPDNMSDHHFRSQTYEMYVHGTALNITIGRFEHLRDGWSNLQKIIPELPNLNLWGASNREDYKLYYNEKLVNAVTKRYSKDLEILDYNYGTATN